MEQLTNEQILDGIDNLLQEQNNNTGKRIELIEYFLDFLNYNMRLTKLSDAEKEDFIKSMEGYDLTDEMRKTLADCKTEEKKNYYIEMWARSTYFRRCAWLSYLHGESKEKPIPFHPPLTNGGK